MHFLTTNALLPLVRRFRPDCVVGFGVVYVIFGYLPRGIPHIVFHNYRKSVQSITTYTAQHSANAASVVSHFWQQNFAAELQNGALFVTLNMIRGSDQYREAVENSIILPLRGTPSPTDANPYQLNARVAHSARVLHEILKE